MDGKNKTIWESGWELGPVRIVQILTTPMITDMIAHTMVLSMNQERGGSVGSELKEVPPSNAANGMALAKVEVVSSFANAFSLAFRVESQS